MTDANRPQSSRAALAAFIGTTIEWYDFYIYGLAAALVFGPLFFTGTSTYVGTLAAFGTFAVGFLARPLGGVIFGHLGDKIGRKQILVITLLMMGIATTIIGLLPTYESIGIWAPILLVLMRVFQGIAVGGEWGGAVLLAAEHAPKGRKVFFASFAQLGSPAGLILALLAFSAASSMDESIFMDWGWRLPFLASVIMLVIGLGIRLGVEETPDFINSKKKLPKPTHAPLVEIWRSWRRKVFIAMAANTFGIAAVYFFTTFMVSYATQYVGVPRTVILQVLFWGAVAQFVLQPVGALIAERVSSERRFLQCSYALAMITPYPLFMLISTGNYALMIIGIVVNIIAGAFCYAVIAGFVTKQFPTSVRYSAISVAYQFCGAIAGGLTPMLGTVLAENFSGQWLPLAIFASILAGISLCAVSMMSDEEVTD